MSEEPPSPPSCDLQDIRVGYQHLSRVSFVDCWEGIQLRFGSFNSHFQSYAARYESYLLRSINFSCYGSYKSPLLVFELIFNTAAFNLSNDLMIFASKILFIGPWLWSPFSSPRNDNVLLQFYLGRTEIPKKLKYTKM